MRRDPRFFIDLGERYLTRCHIDAPRITSEELVAFVLGKRNRADLYCPWQCRELTRSDMQVLANLLRTRAGGYPLQYSTGCVGFLDTLFHIREGVLIPRPETEQLVLRVSAYVRAKNPRRILDIGTGSGVIAISLAERFPDATVVAVDCAPAALALTLENARAHNVADRVTVIASDCCAALAPAEQFDLIVSNPPYVVRSQRRVLDREVQAEPWEALDGGVDGLAFYRRISAETRRYLCPGGVLAYEIGCDQAPAVRALLEAEGFTAIQVFCDEAGRDRVIIAER